jgi:hypothetical protein
MESDEKQRQKQVAVAELAVKGETVSSVVVEVVLEAP